MFSLGEATDHAFHARDKRESSAPFPRQSFFSIALLPAKAKLETTQRYFERNNALQARACYRLMQDAFHGASISGSSIINAYLPDLKAPGAVKKAEVEMVAAAVLKNTTKCGVFRNIKVS